MNKFLKTRVGKMTVLGVICLGWILWESTTMTSFSNHKNNNKPSFFPYLPRLYEGPNQKWDSLQTGKSCTWHSKKRRRRGKKLGISHGQWVCQDCGNGTLSSSSSATCTILKPIGHYCDALTELFDWNNPQQQPNGGGTFFFHRAEAHSAVSSVSRMNGHFHEPDHMEMAPCNGLLEWPCFDITKCPADPEQPMKVYVHACNTNTNTDTNTDTQETADCIRHNELIQGIQNAQEFLPDHVLQFTTNHSEACLYLVGVQNSFSSGQAMIQSPLFRGGQNHILWNASHLFHGHGDLPFPSSRQNYNIELAALVSESIADRELVRAGYDLVLQLPQRWRRPQRYDKLDLHRPRRLLLSFKGQVINWPHPYQHHRYVAAEYWPTVNPTTGRQDVYVDIKCIHHGRQKEYDLTFSPTDKNASNYYYGELLLNSTFVFCPGGGAPSSYRFTEALCADAIPVVMAYFVPPMTESSSSSSSSLSSYSSELDWSRCLVTVSEARIIEIPNLLRQMSNEEIRERQVHCRRLYRTIIGRARDEYGDWTARNSTDGSASGALSTAMMIWRQRIHVAWTRRQLQQQQHYDMGNLLQQQKQKQDQR